MNYDKKGNKIPKSVLVQRMPVLYFLGAHLPADYREWMDWVVEFAEKNKNIVCIYLNANDYGAFITAHQANHRKPWVLSLNNRVIQVLPHAHMPRQYMWGRV